MTPIRLKISKFVLYRAVFGSLFLVALAWAAEGPDPAREFIEEMDKAPAEKRVPNWEHIKALMARVPPEVGAAAPSFTLKTLDGSRSVQVPQTGAGKPTVLVFGSFT